MQSHILPNLPPLTPTTIYKLPIHSLKISQLLGTFSLNSKQKQYHHNNKGIFENVIKMVKGDILAQRVLEGFLEGGVSG